MKKQDNKVHPNLKTIRVKKIIFITLSFFLILDCLFLPFVTAPFVFEEGIKEEYILGIVIVIAFWSHLVWINLKDIKEVKYLSYKNVLIDFSNNQNSYYFHLKMALRIVTLFVSGLILLGLFLIVDQYNLFLKNFHIFLAS